VVLNIIKRINFIKLLNIAPYFIKTNPEKIEKIVSNTKSGGFLYIPKFAFLLTLIAKKLSSVIKLIDRGRP
tara:strand:+ start:2579 stop:2791 length:213 start_codon:yes stop_codon:yes gene_type:complete